MCCGNPGHGSLGDPAKAFPVEHGLQVTAHSLKTKYALSALGIGTVVALVLAGLLFWQFRMDSTRLSELAYGTVEERLAGELQTRASSLAFAGAQRLSAAMATHDWAEAHAIATELLEIEDVAAIELRDALGTVVFSATPPPKPGEPDSAAPIAVVRNILAPARPKDRDAQPPVVGTLRVTLSRGTVDSAMGGLVRDVASSQRGHFIDMMGLLGVICAVLIVLGLIAAWLIAARIEKPIAALIKSADRIGQGDYTRPLAVARKDEIGDLQQALERMRLKLRQTTITKNYLNIVLNSMNDAVLVTSPDGTIKGANEAARRMLGYGEEELIGKSILFVIAESEQPNFAVDQAAQDTRETVVRTRSGQTIPVQFSGSQISTEDPQFQGNIFVARNITERKRAERRIRYLARYDTLTKIPNRMQFQHLLQQALARAARSGTSVALLYLDMDRFKEVNDTFGHAAGDRTLEILTERLSGSLPKDTVLGRLAGDEFALFLESLPRDTDCRGAVANLARIILDDDLQGLLPAEPRDLPDRQHRRRLLPARRRERDRPDPQRRRGDVLLQAERRQFLRVLFARDERGRGRAPDAQEQAAPRAGARRAGDPVPAEGRSAQRPHRRRRGAVALAPARPRRHSALAVHPAGRGNQPDPRNRRMGAEQGLRGLPPLAGARAAARARVDQSLAQAAAPGELHHALQVGVPQARRVARPASSWRSPRPR